MGKDPRELKSRYYQEHGKFFLALGTVFCFVNPLITCILFNLIDISSTMKVYFVIVSVVCEVWLLAATIHLLRDMQWNPWKPVE
jgi:hypothetical protein